MVTELDYLMSSEVQVEKYVGLWVAMVGKRIVASGDSAKDVYDRAVKAFPGEEPFVAKVPKAKVMLL